MRTGGALLCRAAPAPQRHLLFLGAVMLALQIKKRGLRARAQVVRDEAGKLQRLASWDSQGSDLVQFGEAAPPVPPFVAAGGAETRLSPEDDSSPGAEEAVSAERAPGFHKMRRVGAKEVVYTRVLAARAGAAPPVV